MSCIEAGWQSSDSRIMSGDWRKRLYRGFISVHEHIPLAIYCVYMGVSIFYTLAQFIAFNSFLSIQPLPRDDCFQMKLATSLTTCTANMENK